MDRELVRAIGQAVNLDANWPMNIGKMSAEDCYRQSKTVRLERDIRSKKRGLLKFRLANAGSFILFVWSIFSDQSPWMSWGLIIVVLCLNGVIVNAEKKSEHAWMHWERTALIWDALEEYKSVEEEEARDNEQKRLAA